MQQGTEHALRYLSLHDNQYVRYFKGHSARCDNCRHVAQERFILVSSRGKETIEKQAEPHLQVSPASFATVSTP